jgi:hypothetical protein
MCIAKIILCCNAKETLTFLNIFSLESCYRNSTPAASITQPHQPQPVTTNSLRSLQRWRTRLPHDRTRPFLSWVPAHQSQCTAPRPHPSALFCSTPKILLQQLQTSPALCSRARLPPAQYYAQQLNAQQANPPLGQASSAASLRTSTPLWNFPQKLLTPTATVPLSRLTGQTTLIAKLC